MVEGSSGTFNQVLLFHFNWSIKLYAGLDHSQPLFYIVPHSQAGSTNAVSDYQPRLSGAPISAAF